MLLGAKCCERKGKKNIIIKCLRPTEISPSGQDLSKVKSSPFSHQYSRPVGVEPALKCRVEAGEGQLQDLNGHQGLEGNVPSPA